MGAAADRSNALALMQLHGEAERRLALYEALLRKWQPKLNLVAASTLPALWMRHFADSWQVHAACPDARVWVDLGSGAGFPGLVTAILLAQQAGTRVHLIESDQRKCAFLREVSRETGARAIIHNNRIEAVLPEISDPIAAISARGLAPMPKLLRYCEDQIEKGAIGLFLKGAHVASELTDSDTVRRFDLTLIPSATAADAYLVKVVRKDASA